MLRKGNQYIKGKIKLSCERLYRVVSSFKGPGSHTQIECSHLPQFYSLATQNQTLIMLVA